MNRRPVRTSFYSCLTPSRWLKAAVAVADDGMVRLCSRYWQTAVLVPVPVRSPRSRRLP